MIATKIFSLFSYGMVTTVIVMNNYLYVYILILFYACTQKSVTPWALACWTYIKLKIFVFVEVEVLTCYQFANYLFMMDIIHCHKDAIYLQTTNQLFRHFSFLKYIRQTSNIFRPKRKNCRKSYLLLVVVIYFLFKCKGKQVSKDLI